MENGIQQIPADIAAMMEKVRQDDIKNLDLINRMVDEIDAGGGPLLGQPTLSFLLPEMKDSQ